MSPRDRMRAISIREPGSADVLELVECPVPQPGTGELLLRVAAAGVNRPDIVQREGHYPVPDDASPLPGLEVSGFVVDAGPGTGRFRTGDRVMALTHGGGYAEFCRAREDHCLPVPDALSMTDAAAVPETFFTVEFNVFELGALARDEVLLVHGGSSGIGTAAIQLARAAGATVITTAGSDEKCAFCRALGAHCAINYRKGDWSDAVRQFLGDRGVDVILDMVAGEYAPRNLGLLSYGGRYVLIAFLRGAAMQISAARIMRRQLTLTGSMLRPQSNRTKARIAAAVARRALPGLADGSLRAMVFRTFRFEDAAAAQALMESGAHQGKLVLDFGLETNR